MANDYKVRARNLLEEDKYNLDLSGITYVIPIVKTSRAPTEKGGSTIALDKPVNNQTFSLSGKRENGTLDFVAFERFNPQSVDSVYSDRSYDEDAPSGEKHTLDFLITELENSSESGSTAEADRLKAIFPQDSNGNYVVRTVEQQRIWLRDFVDNPGLNAEWFLFGPSYDFRTVDGSNNPQGTPIFLESADIEPSPKNRGRGTGNLQFKVGGRL